MKNLKFLMSDNGNCRVYYTDPDRKGSKYAMQVQNHRLGTFALYACSKDGEPSHEVSLRQHFIEDSRGDDAVDRELNKFLSMLRKVQVEDAMQTVISTHAYAVRLKSDVDKGEIDAFQAFHRLYGFLTTKA